jgi:hypothetical protein
MAIRIAQIERRDHLRLSPEAGKSPAPDRRFEPLSPSGKRRTDGKLGLPRLCWLLAPEGLGIKRQPQEASAPAVSDRTWSEETKSLSLPSSDPSAAPALISRHRFVLCRAVVMFDHRGVAPSTPKEAHNGFAGRMQEGHGKFVRHTHSNKHFSGVEQRPSDCRFTLKTKNPPSKAASYKLRVRRLSPRSPSACFDIRRIRGRRSRLAASPKLKAQEPRQRRSRTNPMYACHTLVS